MADTVVAEELGKIYEEEGELQPRAVVDRARKASHPLHTYFIWDDKAAADRQRLDTARKLIRSVKVVIVPTEEAEEIRVRAYHARRSVGLSGGGYMSESDVREDPELQRLLLRTMQRDWVALQRRYGNQRIFWDLIAEALPEGYIAADELAPVEPEAEAV